MALKLKPYNDHETGVLAGYSFFCPGCKERHYPHIRSVGGCDTWAFNGDMEKPTFSPSILVTGVNFPPVDPATGDYARGSDGEYLLDETQHLVGCTPMVCHSFVRDGRIQFLGDCTHALAGQTVDLPDYKDGE